MHVGRDYIQRTPFRRGAETLIKKLPDDMVMQIDLSPGAALSRAAQVAWSMTALQGRLFWRMVLGQFSAP